MGTESPVYSAVQTLCQPSPQQENARKALQGELQFPVPLAYYVHKWNILALNT